MATIFPDFGLNWPGASGAARPFGGIWMLRRGLLTACFGAFLALLATSPGRASILISIDKPSQTMTVAVDGQVQYRWRVSTGSTRYSTPTGSYKPSRLVKMHYSREWDNAGMPHSIFFTSRGHAIHGSDHPGLGTNVSHGCVRLTLSNAATLFQLVSARGVGNTRVVVRGSDPPGYTVPSKPPQQRRGWFFLPF
jgi:lipoprotein-anchoring transpeptidase ErfK/SrfK